MMRQPSEKAELVLYVFLYAFSLGFTLICGPEADNMYNTYASYTRDIKGTDADPDGWLAILKGDKTFDIKFWKVFAILRFVVSTLGWFLLCKDIHRDLSRGRNRVNKLGDATAKQEALVLRISQLCGRNLGKLALDDIKELRNLQKTGLEESNIQIKLRELGN